MHQGLNQSRGDSGRGVPGSIVTGIADISSSESLSLSSIFLNPTESSERFLYILFLGYNGFGVSFYTIIFCASVVCSYPICLIALKLDRNISRNDLLGAVLKIRIGSIP